MTSSRSSKGQIPQVFLFLMALLVIGATVFIGMRMLGTLGGAACDANDVAFHREITQLLDDRSAFGYKDAARLKVPCDAIALCFVDNSSIGQMVFYGSDSVINASVKGNVKSNIFIRSRDKTVDMGYDERIALERRASTPPSSDRCIPAVSGYFNFKTEGLGRYVIVSS